MAISISKPGVTTAELNREIEQEILLSGAIPTFKGYGAGGSRAGFPAASCISINDAFVHGAPYDYKLVEGDVVSVDIGVTKDGFIADSCFTYGIGEISYESRSLILAGREVLDYGISLVKEGVWTLDLGDNIAEKAEELGYITMPDIYGHGVGAFLHEAPSIPFVRRELTRGSVRNIKLMSGMVITIEPAVTLPSVEHKYIEGSDGWTLKTGNGSYAAQFEHAVLVGAGGCEKLTAEFPDIISI